MQIHQRDQKKCNVAKYSPETGHYNYIHVDPNKCNECLFFFIPKVVKIY